MCLYGYKTIFRFYEFLIFIIIDEGIKQFELVLLSEFGVDPDNLSLNAFFLLLFLQSVEGGRDDGDQ